MRKTTHVLSVTIARGFALFFGLFALLNVAALALGDGSSQNIWWIDLSFMDTVPSAGVQLAAAVFLVWYALFPCPTLWRRIATAGLSIALVVAAIQNATTFFGVVDSGTVSATIPIPFSLIIAAIFAYVAFVAFFARPRPLGFVSLISTVLVVAFITFMFPLAQICLFGTTDYRRSADAAVVLGARVYSDGTLSNSVEERVLTAIELYNEGLVDTLIMSGGIEQPGDIDEAAAMRDYAVEQGVPAEDIIVDSEGDNTDATVQNTIALWEENGYDDVLVVSTFYHLPRIKMAFLAEGYNVYTVPALQLETILQTPYYVAREVPAWWVYWARSLF